jgi:hypothetical protein
MRDPRVKTCKKCMCFFFRNDESANICLNCKGKMV